MQQRVINVLQRMLSPIVKRKIEKKKREKASNEYVAEEENICRWALHERISLISINNNFPICIDVFAAHAL